VITGGAVRLTGSGLGCPTWPECVPGSYTPVPGQEEGALHAWIEFGNRLLTFALLFAALATLISILVSRRRDLRLLGALQILGILAQGLLGGITVLTDLNPIAVGSHLLLSILLIAAATSLHSRRRFPFVRTSSTSPKIARLSIGHINLAFLAIVIGAIVTGTGPHAGDADAPRLDLDFSDITRVHSATVWLLLIVTFFFLRAKGLSFETKKWLWIFTALAIAQGAIGYIQYWLGLPELLVGFHLLGSVLVYIAAWKVRLSIVRKRA
jgi:cytochrome c oxidase assembly protein subunit 15